MNMDEVYQNYAQFIYKYLLSICNDEEIAEELTQETFYQAVKSSARFDGTCKVSTWLCQIAKHLWYQQTEKNKRYKSTILNDNITSDELTVEEKICINDDKMQIFKLVHILDDTSKEVFLLRITGAFSFKEISEVFQKNENWARVTYYRAKQKIMKGRLK
ncbi:MAG: sigma-70 family RNA polymerase sigma factor [Clostridia bacterium]|nr:sigma-70 family RNA polymerase sigma factor [Clostridia bacterium]MDD4798352.1 sigma-70 family RNA polymerase sigma factor [Clostridia bacterium]